MELRARLSAVITQNLDPQLGTDLIKMACVFSELCKQLGDQTNQHKTGRFLDTIILWIFDFCSVELG